MNRSFGWISLRALIMGGVAVVLLFGFIADALSEPPDKKSRAVPPTASPPPPSYTAKTERQVKKQGLVEAAGTKWSCRMNFCTATAPFPPITVASCRAIQSQVGNIAAFGDGKKFLTASELRKCNGTDTAAGETSIGGKVDKGGKQATNTPPMARSERMPTGGGVVGAPPRDRTTAPGGSIGTAALTPAFAKQLSNRIEGFRKAQEALARQRREAAAHVPTAPESGEGSRGDDCDDTDSSVHPGATETCNLYDDNCNGVVDERVLGTFYLDADGDLHGDPSRSLGACPHQLGTMAEGAYLVSHGNDCDDTNPDRWHDC